MTSQTDSQHVSGAEKIHQPARLWWPYPNVLRDSVVLTVVCSGGLCVLNRCYSGGEFDRRLTGENGILEMVQLGVLVATVAVGLFALSRTTVSSWRTVGIALACVAVVGASREIPSLESLPRINEAGLGPGTETSFAVPRYWKHLVILCAGLLFFARGAYAWFAYPADRKIWFSPSFIWPAVPFAACLVLSESFERSGWLIAEEGIEIIAYAMMLTTAIWVARNAETFSQAQLDSDCSSGGPATILLSEHLPLPQAEDIRRRRAA